MNLIAHFHSIIFPNSPHNIPKVDEKKSTDSQLSSSEINQVFAPLPPAPPPDPQFVYVQNAQNQSVLYKKYSQEEEEAVKQVIGTLATWVLVVTISGLVRVIRTRSKVKFARYQARTWHTRCLSLLGKGIPPYKPSMIEKLLYGKRGKYYAEEYNSPWNKIIQDFKASSKTSIGSRDPAVKASIASNPDMSKNSQR